MWKGYWEIIWKKNPLLDEGTGVGQYRAYITWRPPFWMFWYIPESIRVINDGSGMWMTQDGKHLYGAARKALNDEVYELLNVVIDKRRAEAAKPLFNWS